MLYIKCLAQGPRVVVVVMLLAAASTTVLTSSQSAPPSPLVPGPLQASTCFPNRLQALGSTPVDGSPGALPITASSRIPVASGLSPQRLLPVHPCHPTLQ